MKMASLMPAMTVRRLAVTASPPPCGSLAPSPSPLRSIGESLYVDGAGTVSALRPVLPLSIAVVAALLRRGRCSASTLLTGVCWPTRLDQVRGKVGPGSAPSGK